MWSGPRNISTALMRSFENRKDTSVIDEPFYAYYLHKTKLKHPMYREIIDNYKTNTNEIIKDIKNMNESKITLIKHMTHHIDDKFNLDWLKNTKNFFLIRHPELVINSYIKKNQLNNINDLGFKEQLRIFKFVQKFSNNDPVVVNSSSLLKNPEYILKKLCKNIGIKFSSNMLSWPKGKRISDGIWSKVWYQNVINSSQFEKNNERKINLHNKYKKILDDCFNIYSKINKYSI